MIIKFTVRCTMQVKDSCIRLGLPLLKWWWNLPVALSGNGNFGGDVLKLFDFFNVKGLLKFPFLLDSAGQYISLENLPFDLSLQTYGYKSCL